MKKIVFFLFFSTFFSQAQTSILADKKNEVRIDVSSVILSGKYGISYERFLEKDFSVGINANFSSGKKNKEDFDSGYRNNLPKYEINPYVRYALSKGKTSYYFAEVFASANGGDFKEVVRVLDENNSGYYTTQKSNYTDFALGGSLGYKMYFKESFALEFLIGFGKNLFNNDKSPDYVSRAGLNFGYRF